MTSRILWKNIPFQQRAYNKIIKCCPLLVWSISITLVSSLLLFWHLPFLNFTQAVPPDILDYPTSTDMVIREGSNVTLKCAAVGSPTPTIMLRGKAGEPISLPNNTEVIAYNGSLLTITKVQRLNMGAYLYIASNGIRPTVSKRVMLVEHFPPVIWIQHQLVGGATGLDIMTGMSVGGVSEVYQLLDEK